MKEQHADLYAAGLTSLDAARCVDTEDFCRADAFHVFGYPEEGREYDHEKKVLGARLHWLRGEPSEPKNQGLSTIKIVGNRPDAFNGMSGSVVIADIDDVWKFAGMVTLANEKNGLFAFYPGRENCSPLERNNADGGAHMIGFREASAPSQAHRVFLV